MLEQLTVQTMGEDIGLENTWDNMDMKCTLRMHVEVACTADAYMVRCCLLDLGTPGISWM